MPCPSTGKTTIIPSRPVAIPTTTSASMIAAQVSMTGRLFQTSAMLVPMAVNASVRSVSSIGMENALMANAKAANSPPTAPPTSSIAQPVAVVNSIGNDMVEAGERPQAKEQRVDDDGGAHPQQRQQAEQHAGEQNLAARFRPDKDHVPSADGLAFRDAAALFVKSDADHRPDHHEAGKRGKQDVVEVEREQADDGDDGDQETRSP